MEDENGFRQKKSGSFRISVEFLWPDGLSSEPLANLKP